MSGGANGPGVGERDALALAIGSAVLDVLQARGIAAQPKHPGRPSGTVPELETRRSRWVVTPSTYLGAAGAADPAGTLERLIGADDAGGGRGSTPDPGGFLTEEGQCDPAPFDSTLRSGPRRSNYGHERAEDVSDEVRGGYGG